MTDIIDAGHGGTDPGAIGNGIIEKNLTLEITLYQLKRFKELGISMKATRTTDKTLDPNTRTSIVKNSGAKICISNHINAGGGDGAEIIVSLYSTKKFAEMIAAAIRAAGQNVRRIFSRQGSSGDYYYMHRQTGAVETVIVEYGFLDSKGDDIRQLKTDQIKYAEAVVKAYCQYTGKKYTAPGATAVKEAAKTAAAGVLPNEVIEPSDDYNPKVIPIQQYLNYYLQKDLEADGYYGPGTTAAMKAFQKARGIAQDGIYGPNTRRELLEYYAETIRPPQSSKIAPDSKKESARYIVQAGVFSEQERAEALVKNLKDKGFPAFMKRSE